jgi:xanthine dehydrogenase YagS FAD-binding subunit
MSSVACAIEWAPGKTVRQVRMVLGGVGTIPWRVPEAEQFITGKSLSGDTINQAAVVALKGATPMSKNGYKIALTQALIRRTLTKLNA